MAAIDRFTVEIDSADRDLPTPATTSSGGTSAAGPPTIAKYLHFENKEQPTRRSLCQDPEQIILNR
jgi:hypothetical protein